MFKKLTYRTAITAALAALLISPLALSASGEGEQHHKGHHAKAGMNHGDMPDHCSEMMAKHGDMTKHHAEMQASLDGKMAAMQQASGDAKIEAMAAVIEELVGQRNHQAKMMGGMGCQHGCSKTKDGCSMMGEMKHGKHEGHGKSSDE